MSVRKGIVLQALVLVWFFLLAICVRGDEADDLLADLGSVKYAVRERAMKTLKSKMDFSLYMRLKTLKSGDLEATRRIQRILSGYETRFVQETSKGYQADLQGYPDYPWIDSLPQEYQWNGICRWDIIQGYLWQARQAGYTCDGSPNWSDYRGATKMWLEARISLEVSTCLNKATSEKDFHIRMQETMKSLSTDISLLIKGHDDWCVRLSLPKPKKKEAF